MTIMARLPHQQLIKWGNRREKELWHLLPKQIKKCLILQRDLLFFDHRRAGAARRFGQGDFCQTSHFCQCVTRHDHCSGKNFGSVLFIIPCNCKSALCRTSRSRVLDRACFLERARPSTEFASSESQFFPSVQWPT